MKNGAPQQRRPVLIRINNRAYYCGTLEVVSVEVESLGVTTTERVTAPPSVSADVPTLSPRPPGSTVQLGSGAPVGVMPHEVPDTTR